MRDDKYEIRSIDPNCSVLIVRDFNPLIDDGVYRCFATRNGYGGSDTVYVETEVKYPGVGCLENGLSCNLKKY